MWGGEKSEINSFCVENYVVHYPRTTGIYSQLNDGRAQRVKKIIF